MLDIKSKLVLKILIKECNNGAYKIIEVSDIISALPSRYKTDSDGIENILSYLERQDCISIKYDDDNVYCLCVLPYGYEICETEIKKGKDHKKSSPSILFLILFFVFSFLGGFLGSFIASLII